MSVPAAVAGLAYLNARSSFWYDALMVRSVLPALLTMAWRRRKGTMSIFYQLEERALSSSTANHPFLLFGDNSYTYAEVYDKALRYGNWWKETLGVKKDDVVAINYMNSDTFIFLWFGLWAIGAKPAFINYNLRDQALVHCIKTAKSKLMIVDPEIVEALTPSLREELADVRIEVFSDLIKAQADGSKATRYPDEVRFDDKPESPAMLIFTSGTTGLPKAAVISWAKMISTGNFARGWISLKNNDVYYTVSSNTPACGNCAEARSWNGQQNKNEKDEKRRRGKKKKN